MGQLLFLLLSLCIGNSSPPAKGHAKDKLNCNDKELNRQDCHLYAGSYDFRLLPKTIAWTDGTWHTVDAVPLKGEALAWEKIHFEVQSGWPLLQFWLWEKGVSETEVQSLHWIVARAEKRKVTVLIDGIVRKRRLEPVDPPPEIKDAKAPVKPPKVVKPKYLYDGWESYGLKVLKNGDLEWQLNAQKKVIGKTGG